MESPFWSRHARWEGGYLSSRDEMRIGECMRRNLAMYAIPGLYKIQFRPHWVDRSLPQLIATARVLKSLAETRENYDLLDDRIHRIWKKIAPYEHQRVLYMVSRPARALCCCQFAEVAELLEEEPEFSVNSPEYRMRVVLTPNLIELRRICQYWYQSVFLQEHVSGFDFSFFLPECVFCSLYAAPSEVAAVLYARRLRGCHLSFYEQMFLYSRWGELEGDKSNLLNLGRLSF